MVAVVIVLRVFARMSWWRTQDINCSKFYHFAILRLGERVTSFTKDNNANFSSEKWENEAFREVYILRKKRKNLKSNLVLIVVLVPESKGLYCINRQTSGKRGGDSLSENSCCGM